jgi:hypothetical protein
MPCHSAQILRILPPALLLTLGLMPTVASADVVFTASGTSSSGALGATVDFQAINGGIEVTVTNTLASTATVTRGEAISAFSFSLNGLNNPTSFYQLSGNSVDSSTFVPGSTFPGSSPVTPFNDTSATNTIDHWSLATSGSNILATAGPTAPGQNPVYMILPSSGITGSASSLADGHFDPYILGPGNFFLAVNGVTSSTVLTASEFSGVTVGFGTTPDTTLNAQLAPEPASIVMLGLGFLAVGGVGLRWRRRGAAGSDNTAPVVS